MGFRIGIVGLGFFGRHFIPLFRAHPLCSDVALCELRSDVLSEIAKEHEIDNTFTDFDDMLRDDTIDGVAIFTQRWTHEKLAIKALNHGKHVYSAVPSGVSVEGLQELVETVARTGLTYALGETSFYRAQAIYCRQRYAAGDFGEFVYGEGQYYHDMAHWFYLPFYDANGDEWKRFASVPPMWYITHSASHVLSTTMGRFTHVSCFGRHDTHEDGLFDKRISAFDNDYSNQSALFKTSEGGMARINEFRRNGAGESRGSIIGTKASYEEQANPNHGGVSVAQEIEGKEQDGQVDSAASQAVWVEHYFEHPPYKEDGSYDYVNAQHWHRTRREDLTWIHRMDGVEITEDNLGSLPRSFIGKRHLGVSPMHPVHRLPAEYVGLPNGHAGSHQFLVHDFLEAIDTGKLPPNNVWNGARYSLPGIVAHESCMREGERLSIPDFGVPPAGMECLDPLVKLKE